MKAELKCTVLCGFILLNLLAFTAGAQVYESYDINWSTIDGGGGAASGGVFSLNGTIGQPDAGAVGGGVFTITGGFWAAPAESLPRLAIRLLPGTPKRVTLSWPNPTTGFFHLQRLCDGVGWADVPETPVVTGPNQELTLLATSEFCMFRLKGRFTP